MRHTLLIVASILLSLNTLAQPGRPTPQPRQHPAVHDPVMAQGEDGRYYIFATGMGVGVMSSSDMKEWRNERPVFNPRTEIPQWAKDSVPGYRGHTWAPDISRHDGKWLLYYSCSTFGKNTSAIGLATNKTLDPNSPDFKWEDQGMVIKSYKHVDNWNAIDPNLIVVGDKRVLTYGSFWDGIQLICLDKDYKTPITKPITIARRITKHLPIAELDQVENFTIEGGDTIEAGANAIEAPFITYRNGWYYLFVSFDYCCRGQASTYKTVYGRSRNVEGPYIDKNGKPMAKGGGTFLYGPDDNFFGVGHNSVYQFNNKWYFVSHAYDKKRNGAARLFVEELKFDNEGWIIK